MVGDRWPSVGGQGGEGGDNEERGGGHWGFFLGGRGSRFREAVLLLSDLDFYVTSPRVTMLATRFLSDTLRVKQNSPGRVGAGLSPRSCEMGQSCLSSEMCTGLGARPRRSIRDP